MQTNEGVLSKFKEDLKLRNISIDTQNQYLCLARIFFEWSKLEINELREEDIGEYLDYLANIRKLSASSVNVRNVLIRLLFGTITGDERFCPKPRVKPIKNGYLKNDKKAFIRYLVELDYVEDNLRNYKWTINCLERFMHEHKKPTYSCTIGETFLSEFAKTASHTPGVLEMMGYIIRRFTCFMEQGEYVLVMPRLNKECPPQFAKKCTNLCNVTMRKAEDCSSQKRNRSDENDKAFESFVLDPDDELIKGLIRSGYDGLEFMKCKT